MYFVELEGLKDGRKIKANDWGIDEYIFWSETSKLFKTDTNTEYFLDERCSDGNWEYYQEPKAKIKIYAFVNAHDLKNDDLSTLWFSKDEKEVNAIPIPALNQEIEVEE